MVLLLSNTNIFYDKVPTNKLGSKVSALALEEMIYFLIYIVVSYWKIMCEKHFKKSFIFGIQVDLC